MFYMPYKILTLKRGKSLTDSSLVKLFKGSMSGIEIIPSLCRLEIPWHASVCLLCVNVGVHVCVCDLTMSCQYIFKADMNMLHFKPTKWQSWHVPPHSHRHTRIPVSSELSQCPHYGRHYHSFGLQTLHKGRGRQRTERITWARETECQQREENSGTKSVRRKRSNKLASFNMSSNVHVCVCVSERTFTVGCFW